MFKLQAMDAPSANKRKNNDLKEQSKKLCMTNNLARVKSDLLAGIFCARVASQKWARCEYDDILVDQCLSVCSDARKVVKDHLPVLCTAFASDVHHCLVEHIVNKKFLLSARVQDYLDYFFVGSFERFALGNAEYLLKMGASPHIALPASEHEHRCVSYYGVTQLAYLGDLKRLRLLLRYGASLNLVQYQENPLISALQAETLQQPATINMLLYFGADPNLRLQSYRGMKPLGFTALKAAEKLCELCPRSKVLDSCYKALKMGHARRVYRMAHCLRRLTYLPLDVTYLFTEYLYGKKIEQHDRKLFATMSPGDYKKDRSIIILNIKKAAQLRTAF